MNGAVNNWDYFIFMKYVVQVTESLSKQHCQWHSKPISTFTEMHHWTQFANWIQSTLWHPIYLGYILILSSHITYILLLIFQQKCSVHFLFPHACYMPDIFYSTLSSLSIGVMFRTVTAQSEIT
jgi:hypothetical protein